MIDLDGPGASAWADAGEWSDPTGWSGEGWDGLETSTDRDLAAAGRYQPVPGAPGVFGRQGPAPPFATGSAPVRAAPPGEEWSPAGQWAAQSYADGRPHDTAEEPEPVDSGGWAAAGSAPAGAPAWGQSQVRAPGRAAPAEEERWEYAPPPRGRRGWLALLAVGIAAALVAGTVVAVRALPSRSTAGGPTTGPTPGLAATASGVPAASMSSPAAPRTTGPSVRPTTGAPTPTSGTGALVGSPPSRLSIVDGGATITLTWRDPSDGTVPFIVAGARRGDESHPMQSIPAGRTRSTIHGLNTGFDYCFTVAAVYSIDVVARSGQVCTHRLSTATTP